MIFTILFCFGIPYIKAYYTSTPPVIDGRIEPLWKSADSITTFTQLTPYSGESASEPTTVWVLYDDENLYVAYRCETPGRKPVAMFSGSEDVITLYIDTFRDKTTCYFFSVGASGQYWDGIILDDGRLKDFSWEGVWFTEVKLYPHAYIIEIKIPFKTLRYKKGAEVWGINFERYIYPNQEEVYWAPMKREEGLRVSRFGELKGIKPKAKGYHLEVYPVAFVRHEKYKQEEPSTYPSAGLNLSWGLTPDLRLLTTFNPDFAEIEADPYTVNLSKYETYFAEQRPFFVEGREHFEPASLGREAGFYAPMEVFYSRRIGKRLPGGKEVPISVAIKLIGKAERWDGGAILARTEKIVDEPQAYWGTARYQHKIFENSSIGFLYASKESKESYTRALGIDGALRTHKNQFLYQIVGSDYCGKKGFGMSSGFSGMIKGFMFFGGGAHLLSGSLNIEEIGYLPQMVPGERRIFIFGGPIKFYKKGWCQQVSYGIGGGTVKLPGEEDWSREIITFLNPLFRNNWGFSLNVNAGKTYEADTSYNHKHINFSMWSGGGRKWNVSFGGWGGYSWNYARRWLAWSGSQWGWISYTPATIISISASLNSWAEWKPNGRLCAITLRFTPRIEFTFTRDISLNVYSESVPVTEEGSTRLYSNRIGFLFSWRVAPKSKIYIAFNDYRERGERNFLEKERIGILKIKYLFYF